MAERAVRLPHTRKREPKTWPLAAHARALVWIGAIVVLVALIYLVARDSSMFAVTRIEVKGAPPAVASQARLALRFVDGHSLLRLDGAGVVAALERLPSVHRATYDRDFPHTLRIRIVPERPVAVLRRGIDSWLVSARSRVIVKVRRGAFATLPRIWLGRAAVVELGAVLRDPSAEVGSQALSSFKDAGLGARISFVKATDDRLVAGLRTGLELRFGPPVDLELKLAVARAVLPTLAAPSGGGPRYLDVTVPERPVAGTDSQVEG
jgi:cell division septal protein FtsQ